MGDKMLYLDWNVFNNIEKVLNGGDNDVYKEILNFIQNTDCCVPYSNAHLNDLLRGYLKTKEYIDGHLNCIKEITKDLCIIQYWDNDYVTKHTRYVDEFWELIIDEVDMYPKSFSKLITSIGMGEVLNIFESISIPNEFFEKMGDDSLFDVIFDETKEKKNLLALIEDCYGVLNKINSDYRLYKHLKKFIISSINELNKNNDLELKEFLDSHTSKRNYLKFDDLYINNRIDIKTCNNPNYDKIIDYFTKLDMSGENSDDKFQNMLDDALHTFYAAHCEYFITTDKKCYRKATELYKNLGIETKVMLPDDFVKYIKSINNN